MQWTLFEDDQFTNLMPLVYFRPVWELRCGVMTLKEKAARHIGSPPEHQCRGYLERYFHLALPSQDGNTPRMWINGRWLMTADDLESIHNLREDAVLIRDKTPLAFRAAPNVLRKYLHDGVLSRQKLLRYLPRHTEYRPARVINYPWDIISRNGDEIRQDYRLAASPGKNAGNIYPGVQMLNKENITIENGATLQPNVVVDAENGPVWIDEDATIMANSVLVGPLYIGKKSRIKIAAKIYENTTVGPVCKVGGEVEGSIIHGYSNKQHDGFLGHAYLGEWVNIGADTNNSDLKNNYGDVQVFINGRKVNSGQRFVGLMMGDHSKCAINTMFNTGTVVGVSANVFGSGMPPKFMPSFAWGGAEEIVPYDFPRALQLAETVMGRRGIPFGEPEIQLFMAVRDLAAVIEDGTVLTSV